MLWHLGKLIELAPDDWRHHARKGAAHTNEGEFDEARGAYEKAERLDAVKVRDWYRHRATVCYGEERRQAGDWYVARALSRGHDWQLIAARGHAFRAEGKRERGDADWLRAIPGADVRLLWPAVDEWASRGKFDHALAALRQLDKVRRSARIDYCQAVASAITGDEQGHRKYLPRLFDHVRQSLSLLDLDAALGVAVLSDAQDIPWLDLGKQCDATLGKLKEYETNRKNAPMRDQIRAIRGRMLATRAWLWIRVGKESAALHAARESAALGGGSRAWSALAVGHHREGRPAEARHCLLRAVHGVEQDPWHRAEGELLRRKAEKELAKRDKR
jgi:tetratricopeptide (TPR) repeat protein